MTKSLRDILIIVGIIILAIILGKYFKDKIIVGLGGYTTQTTDTIKTVEYVQGKIDTIAVFDHYVETHGIVLEPKTKIVYITVKDPVLDVEVVDSLKQFTVQVKDSLIDGKMVITNRFNGDLESSIFNYKPLFPKYITRVDTIKSTTTVTKLLSNERSLLGVGAGYNNLQYLSILGSYTTKSKWQFIYEYGKSVNSTIEIVQGVPFELNSSDLHSIKIIKHF